MQVHFLVKRLLWFCCYFFVYWRFLTKPKTLRTCPFGFLSITRNLFIFSLKTIPILIKFPFQQYIICRHLNFNPIYENGHHNDFLRFWKSQNLGLFGHLAIGTKMFLEVIGPHKYVKQELCLDSKIFMGLYHRTSTRCNL